MSKILIMDDEPIARTVLERQLQRLNPDYDIKVASSCEEARPLLSREKYDIVVLDVRLRPDNRARANLTQHAQKGLDFYEEHRDLFEGTHVICITTFDTRGESERATALGIQYFFHRLINDDILLDLVKKLTKDDEGTGPV